VVSKATVSHISSGACAKAHTIERLRNVVAQHTVTLAVQQTDLWTCSSCEILSSCSSC
jgi:hypothetical protein